MSIHCPIPHSKGLLRPVGHVMSCVCMPESGVQPFIVKSFGLTNVMQALQRNCKNLQGMVSQEKVPVLVYRCCLQVCHRNNHKGTWELRNGCRSSI